MWRIAVSVVLIIGVVAISIPYVWQYVIFPEETVTQVINTCSAEADKIYALDITKWADEHHTNAFNPYRKGRDQFTEDCVRRDGRWCSTDVGRSELWPCPWEECFVPISPLGKWLWQVRYNDRAHWKCG